MSRKGASKEDDRYRDTFSLYDKDGSGYITSAEIGDILRSLGNNPSQKEIKEILEAADLDNDNQINYREFVQMMEKKTDGFQHGDSKDLHAAFKVFDKNGDGYITSKELYSIMTTLGEKLTKKEADEMIREADMNKDGKIDYEEFVNLMDKMNA